MYGTRKPGLWWVFRSKEWVTVPMNVFVIEHDDGLVLFDTGIDPAATTRAYWPDAVTNWFVRHIFRFDVDPEDRLGDALRRAGYRAEDVTAAVHSHLHFDHAGGIADIPQADLFVARDGWDFLVRSSHPEREYVTRQHVLVPGARWRLLDFSPTDDPELAPFTEACDVMGDGSLMVVPTPGHLVGSVSMLVRRAAAPPVLLIGDLTYSEELLLRNQTAGTGDKEALLQSYAKVQTMKANNPDLVVVASHDTTAVDKLAAARIGDLAAS
ncbi:MAG: N-acyl homoserine lactonase family protein [Ilumatobacter sp.]|uniref:N-acyl homoserine lactonase family protein n=1 Tax=Ilumatobacter sp. TaxID=1967498 RepID=UPI0026283A4F|nr:N-acyl homoserine lactonase family protein [Ilumatobacter sp.]MDJ0770357.1 N-acyl homoserine lactonase family protein [Ilumatobacter sp.]